VIELDKIFWQPGLVPTPRDQWVSIQQKLIEPDGWIMEGDLGPTMPLKFAFVPLIPLFSWISR
jgi:hypothetical protein